MFRRLSELIIPLQFHKLPPSTQQKMLSTHFPDIQNKQFWAHRFQEETHNHPEFDIFHEEHRNRNNAEKGNLTCM